MLNYRYFLLCAVVSFFRFTRERWTAAVPGTLLVWLTEVWLSFKTARVSNWLTVQPVVCDTATASEQYLHMFHTNVGLRLWSLYTSFLFDCLVKSLYDCHAKFCRKCRGLKFVGILTLSAYSKSNDRLWCHAVWDFIKDVASLPDWTFVAVV